MKRSALVFGLWPILLITACSRDSDDVGLEISAIEEAAMSVAAGGDDPAQIGEVGPLIPVPKDAVNAGLSWRPGEDPKICLGMRPSEYRTADAVDENRELKPEFRELVYGDYGYSTGPHGLEQSLTRGDLDRDNFVCWDLTHPDAFRHTGAFSILDDEGEPLVDTADLALTRDAFSDAGDAGGLNYNMFCSGNVALADGRFLYVGGHDKAGNAGIRKMNLFDPVTETWADRGIAPVKEDFMADPTGELFEHADPMDEDNTDPAHSSDMKYQRWYPTAVTLPDESVLVLNGTDMDTGLGPAGWGASCETRESHAACSKRRIVTPELYFPSSDSTIALENARKLLVMYAQSYPVQTGDGPDDWKVAVIGEAATEFYDPEETFEGLPPLDLASGFDPWGYTGRTYLFDVRAARDDPAMDVPGENHWEHVADAKTAHTSGSGAQLWETDKRGKARSQKVVLFGGGCGSVPRIDGERAYDCPRDVVESIDFSDQQPRWRQHDSLIKEGTQNNTVVLPDGKVLVVGGSLGRGPWELTMALQLFDPKNGSITPVAELGVPRHDHSTVALLPDGRVMILGGNATDLTGDPTRLDVSIPNAEIYSPPYLFRGDRPRIESAPASIAYGERFKIDVDRPEKIRSVVLIRHGPVTHNFDWGNRYVKLWSQHKRGELNVQAPSLPALAVPGYYMLFVVDNKGVPSEATVLHVSG